MRVVITGAEGLSKSTTCTQFAITLAAGMHPWTGKRFGPGLRVLLVDTENDEEQTQVRYGWVGDRVNRLGGEPGWAKRIHHQIRPEGLDLVDEVVAIGHVAGVRPRAYAPSPWPRSSRS